MQTAAGDGRTGNALLGSSDIALGKARTAALFGMRTEDVGDFAMPGGTSPGLGNSNGGFVIFAGGIPVYDADALVGAIGASGGAVEQDRQIAQAAVAALESHA